MILILGSTTEFIRVTTEYSNAVLVALLPCFSDCAQKLDLPAPHPIKAADVVHCAILPWRQTDGSVAGAVITLKNGLELGFQFGYVDSFSRGHTYYGLQDPAEIPEFFGEVRMSKEEAIELARNTIKKLGIPLEAVFAEQEPRVKNPPRIGTNTVPRFRIEWMDPSAAFHAVDMEINADSKRVERLWMLNENLKRPPPKLSIDPPNQQGSFPYVPPKINPAYVEKLIPIVLSAIDDYAQKLSLPIPRPLTTNRVYSFSVSDNGGWPHCEIVVTNGWRFIYRNSMVNGFYAPDNLFGPDHPMLIKDFLGTWNITEAQAIELVREALAKLNYPTNHVHMDFPPIVYTAAVIKEHIPRHSFEWWYTAENLQSKVEAEVDCDKGELKSLYYDDVSNWNHPPPIDVPISLPPSVSEPGAGQKQPTPPPRRNPGSNFKIVPQDPR